MVLPIGALSRASQALGQTGESLAEMAHTFRNKLPEQDGQELPGDPRTIADPCERFELIYKLNGWTPEEVIAQHKAVRRSKFAALVMAVVALVGYLVAMLTLPAWMLLVLVPVGGCLLILGAAQTFRFALYESQLELRSLISAREFASRNDFFRRLVR